MSSRIFVSIFAVMTASLSIVACGSSVTEDNLPVEDSADEDLNKKASSTLVGSWTASDESSDFSQVLAYHFAADGSFFRDRKSVLMGMVAQNGNGGAPFTGFRISRDSGTYKVSSKGTSVALTIKWDGYSDKETLSFTYTPGHVLMGMYKPGAPMNTTTGAKLTLKSKGGEAVTFEHADSWCTSAADCTLEAKDKTWFPIFAGNYVCSQNTHTCTAMASSSQ